jgi:hypothetical protein
MKYEDKNGEIKIVLIEIKPEIQTKPPQRKQTPTGKPTRRFLNEVSTWGVNQAKWKAAEKYAKDSSEIYQTSVYIQAHVSHEKQSSWSQRPLEQ